jgi:hypothetical protein
MSTATKTFTGTRAVLMSGANELGIFESVETGVDQDHFVPFVLGRASGGEIAMLGQAPIMMRLSGYRKIGSGPYSNAGFLMLKLQDIIADNIDNSIFIYDRQTINKGIGAGGAAVAAQQAANGGGNGLVAGMHGAKVIRHNLSVAVKSPARLSIELVGLFWEDSDGVHTESGTAY